jgi:hypothetical protein
MVMVSDLKSSHFPIVTCHFFVSVRVKFVDGSSFLSRQTIHEITRINPKQMDVNCLVLQSPHQNQQPDNNKNGARDALDPLERQILA